MSRSCRARAASGSARVDQLQGAPGVRRRLPVRQPGPGGAGGGGRVQPGRAPGRRPAAPRRSGAPAARPGRRPSSSAIRRSSASPEPGVQLRPPQRRQVADQHLLHQRVGEPPAPRPAALDDQADGDGGVQRAERLLRGRAGRLQQVEGHLAAGDRATAPAPRGSPPGSRSSRVRSTSPTDGGTGTRSRCRSWAPTIQRDSSTTKNGLPPVRSCTAEASDRSPGEPSWAASSAATSSASSPHEPQAGRRRLPGQPGQAVGDRLGQLLADRPRGDHQQDRRPRQVPGQQPEQLHRRGVGALQVVEDHEHRRRGGRRPSAGRGGPGTAGSGRRRRRRPPACGTAASAPPGRAARAPASTATARVRRRRRRTGSTPPPSRPRGPASAAASASRVLPIPASPSRTTTAARPAADLLGDRLQLRQLGPPADQRLGCRGRATAAGGGGVAAGRTGRGSRSSSLGSCRSTACSRSRSSGPGVDAQLVAQQLGAAAERVQRLRLPVGGVEGGDQPGPQPLAQRVLGDQVLQVGDRGVRAGPTASSASHRRSRARTCSSVSRSRSVVTVGQVAELGQRLAPPQAERLVEQGDAARRVAGPHGAVAGLDQLGEAQQVQVRGVGPQQVAGRAGQQHGRRLARPAVGLEHPAQVGDVGLQRPGDRRRRVVAPQRADDAVDADDAARRRRAGASAAPGAWPRRRPAGCRRDP